MEILNNTHSYPPTIGDSYGNGWKQLWKFFPELLLIGIIYFLIGLPLSFFGLPRHLFSHLQNLNDLEDALRTPFLSYPNFMFYLAYSFLLYYPLRYGVSFAYLKASRRDKVEIRDMFSFTSNYLSAVLATLLTGFILAIGFIMLIIPGIIFACKLAFVPYLVIDKKMDAVAALKASWEMTNGHAIDIFVMGIMAFFIAVIGLLLLIVGIIPAIMWIKAAFASLYHAVDMDKRPTI